MSAPATEQDVASAMAAMVAAIGRADFAGAFLGTMQALTGTRLCSVFRREPVRGIALVFAAGEQPALARFSLVASRDYARAYWRSDAQLAPLWQTRRQQQLVVRRRACDIASRSYRTACYERAGIDERVSVLWPGTDALVASGYGGGAAAPLDRHASDRLQVYGQILLAALRQHQAQGRARAADEPDVIEQLLSLDPSLSIREAEVAAALILGETQQSIAASKHLSPATVVTYRRRAYAKLGVANRRGLVALHRGTLTAATDVN